jgi:hypothetical protein
VQAVLPGVASHRLQWSSTRRPGDSEEAGERLLAQVPVP